jgi:CRP/FNR family transcriptional regulator
LLRQVTSSQVFFTSALGYQPLRSETSRPACSVKPNASSMPRFCDTAALEAFPAALLSSHATLLRTRPRQSLALTVDLGETAFIVGAGTLSVHITLGTTSQAVTLLFPGDLFRSSFAPPQAKAALVSAAKAEVWRLRASALEELATRDPAIARFVDQALVNQMARRAMHAVMLGQFDGEQKVATFLAQVRNSRRA